MNKIKDYLCNADPIDIVAIIMIIGIFGGLAIMMGVLQFLSIIGVGIGILGILFGFGFVLCKLIELLQTKCKH